MTNKALVTYSILFGTKNDTISAISEKCNLSCFPKFFSIIELLQKAMWKTRTYLKNLEWKPNTNCSALLNSIRMAFFLFIPNIVRNIISCLGFHGFSVSFDLLKESNAKNRTISLNIWHGNQTQMLLLCGFSLKGVCIYTPYCALP